MSKVLMTQDAAVLATGRPYAERSERVLGLHDKVAEFLIDSTYLPLRRVLRSPVRALNQVIAHVERHEQTMKAAADGELRAIARKMRTRLRRDGFAPELVGECFSLVREAAARTIGHRHFESQLMGGWALLQGKLIEMATGEGKTMAATLPACTVALAGYPVHVITVNDYLAGRDAHEMGSLYGFLGLSVGSVVQGMLKPDRREAYARSVTYCSNKELAFDYLRDRVALSHRGSRLHLALGNISRMDARREELVLRGLYFGIIDEADSVFIDEARTPLILSAASGAAEEKEQFALALDFGRSLKPGLDFSANLAERSISLTSAGQEALEKCAADLGGLWTSARAREELVTQALAALILYQRDHQYVVSDGKVQIVDESTGRVMPDRSWERGLHQLIEVKEGCEPTLRRETLARLTYQRLFRRYVHLSGMSGTAREVAREVRSIYGLDVVRIPLNQPSRRKHFRPVVCATRSEKWLKVADAVARWTSEGRPVLIGTRSVRASEEVSAVLSARGVEHALLNAKQDQEEADIVALGGQASRVTVATNMAGRGTDIRLGQGVADRGGLHVILTEYHESQRVDRQFFGRCARQGDPGSCQAIVSLEDEIYAINVPNTTALLRRLCRRSAGVPRALHALLRKVAQSRAEQRNAYVRLQNIRHDGRLDKVLAFSGRGE